MKFLLKSIFIVLLFLTTFLIFLPKEGLYNLLETKLLEQNIIVSNEIREEKPFGLNINGSEIYYNGINTAFIKDIDFTTYFFYTDIEIDILRVSKDFRNIIPSKIKAINLKHSILSFNKIDIKVNGEFGKFEGKVLIFDRKIIGELEPSEIMKSKYRNILNQFKLVEGKYKYEFKF